MNADSPFGPHFSRDGVTFRLWAPAANNVELLADCAYAMEAGPDGWFSRAMPCLPAGTRYKYRIDGELEVPDPASHFQPQDFTGPSEIIDHEQFVWRAQGWRGRPWRDAAILELHVGAFTPGGSFRSAIDKLDEVADCGLTAIELMPVADFAGRRNWGYDGVLLFAPDNSYGRPEDLKALIDAAHIRGLMVFLDVVYNHFGPEGNYLPRYAPAFFTEHRHTPWGAAIDYRVPEVRAFAIQNALHWLKYYRFDGLRLDAVHAITEPGEPHILHDLSRAVGQFALAAGREIHLILENDDNRASLLDPHAPASQGGYRAQWNDDYHHAWHVLLTGETHGYYRDYADNPRRHLARTLSSGFAYQGERSAHRGGRRRGEATDALTPSAFIDFLQNHDQIGNRPRGDRLAAVVQPPAIEAALAVTLLAPMPPMLFMGEEWGATAPFPFFCDFAGDLAEAVRKGRREEFKSAYAEMDGDIPDPLLEATFRSAILDWQARATPAGEQRLALVRHLLITRKIEIVPRLSVAAFGDAHFEGDILQARWHFGAEESLFLLANLSQGSAPRSGALPGRLIWGATAPPELPPWSVYWSIG